MSRRRIEVAGSCPTPPSTLSGGLDVATAPLRDATTRRLPRRQIRGDHRRFRTADDQRTKAPSIGSPRASRPERARPRLLFTRAASLPHPVARRARRLIPSRIGWPLRAIPYTRLRLESSIAQTLSTAAVARKRCVSPTSATDSTTRAPCGLLDSRWRPDPRDASRRLVSRARRPTLGFTPSGDEVGASPSAYQMSHPGGASLDGEPPASASAATRHVGSRLAPLRPREPGIARSWWSSDRQLLRAMPPGRGVLDRGPSSRRSL